MSDKKYFLYEFIKLLLIKVGLQATESLEKTFFTASYGHLHIHHRIFFHLKKQGKVKIMINNDYVVEKMDYHRLAY